MILQRAIGGTLWAGPPVSVWARPQKGGGGTIMGSLGAFLVIESRAHAQARGAKVHARIADVLSERAKPDQLADASALRALWERIGGTVRKGEAAMFSAATGVAPATAAERAFLATLPDLPVRATGTYIGHSNEAQFTMNLALAAIALGHGTVFPPKDGAGLEKPMTGPLKQVVVASVGLWRGAGMALVEAP
jgi:3-oxoacyl-[acyl-carrier-protein] synthase II